jgi:hypothetical protein
LACLSRTVQLNTALVTSLPPRTTELADPATPIIQRMRTITHDRFRQSSHFARRYSGSRKSLSFPGVLRCFSSHRMTSRTYIFRPRCLDITPDRLPHSEIFGSKLVRQLPEAYRSLRVLHRLLAPRHPPHALISLTTKYQSKLKSHLPLFNFQRT